MKLQHCPCCAKSLILDHSRFHAKSQTFFCSLWSFSLRKTKLCWYSWAYVHLVMQDQTLETQLDVPLATYPCGESLNKINKPYIVGIYGLSSPRIPTLAFPTPGWITFMMTCRQRAQRKTCGGTHNAKPSDFHMHTHIPTQIWLTWLKEKVTVIPTATARGK